jgi:hypothetical protein
LDWFISFTVAFPVDALMTMTTASKDPETYFKNASHTYRYTLLFLPRSCLLLFDHLLSVKIATRFNLGLQIALIHSELLPYYTMSHPSMTFLFNFFYLFLSLLAWTTLRCPSTDAFLPPTMMIPRHASSTTTTSRYMFDFLKPKEPEKPPEEEPEKEVQDFSEDPVDKIFGFFFGQKEEAPMGMKRFGRGMSKDRHLASLACYHYFILIDHTKSVWCGQYARQ